MLHCVIRENLERSLARDRRRLERLCRYALAGPETPGQVDRLRLIGRMIAGSAAWTAYPRSLGDMPEAHLEAGPVGTVADHRRLW